MESRKKIYKIYNKFKRPVDIIDANEVCNSKHGFKLELQQEFLKKYIIDNFTAINKILLYHSIGSGKTCTSITIAEEIMSYNKNYKTLVILPARLNSNYIDELISSCGFNKYISKEDYNNFIAFDTPLKVKKIIERQFMKLINENYTFYSYEKLFNLAKKQSNIIEWVQSITKNKVIIIDEVHNLINGKYDIKDKSLTQSLFYHLFLTNLDKSSKSFFLTATPIFDNYGQFIELAKVLNTDVKIDGSENIKKIINLLKGKISYYDATNLNAYPSIEYKIEEIPLTQIQNNIISSLNNPDEDNDEIDNTNEMFLIKQRQYSISTISNISSISNNKLSLYAPKLVKIKDSIIENKGKHLIYCTFIKKGLHILEDILKRYGYINYYNDSTLDASNNYKRYIIWDSKLKNTQKQSIKNILNSYENVDGNIIKVILGSPSIKEGISFKHIQHLHIVDPVWNVSAMNQIEGRAIRFCSHVDISPTDKNLKRTVVLHYYKSIANPSLVNPISQTCDERIYDVILPKKEIIINACENALKKIAFDHYLFNKHSLYNDDDDYSLIDIEDLKEIPHNISISKKLKNNCPKSRRPINDVCRKGYMIKNNANGFKCCYKIRNVITKSSCPKNRRPIDDKCNDGYYNKLNKKGDKCCYKIRIKKCPDTKEIHPITGKCVPLCKEGKIRNSKGRCITNGKNPKPKQEPKSRLEARPDLKSSLTLNDKYKKYKLLNEKLSKIKDACLVPTGTNEFILDNKIKLFEYIASGAWGVVYKAKLLENDDKDNYFAVKIQINNREMQKELFILNKLKKYNNTEFKNPHLPLIFDEIKCNNIDYSDERIKKLFINVKEGRHKHYLMLYNNLAEGDFDYYYTHIAKNNFSLWKNAIEQIYMSIASLHSLGVIHNDSQHHNFLFYKIKPGGCFHYIMDGVDYYIENLGYLWNIWDFGLSLSNYRYSDFIKDYNQFNLSLRKNDKSKRTEKFIKKFKEADISENIKWGLILEHKTIPKEIEELEKKLWEITYTDTANLEYLFTKNQIYESMWFKNELLDKNILFSNKPIGNIIYNIKIESPYYHTYYENYHDDRSKFYINFPQRLIGK